MQQTNPEECRKVSVFETGEAIKFLRSSNILLNLKTKRSPTPYKNELLSRAVPVRILGFFPEMEVESSGACNMGMNDLPLDISSNIFSRLPIDSVLDSKLVCKKWCNLIKNPAFAQFHLSHRKLLLHKFDEDLSTNASENVESGFLLLEEIKDKPIECRLHYVEYDVDAKNKSYTVKNRTINIPPINNQTRFDRQLVMVNSCNGLICSTMRHHRLNDPIYICNPVTREFVYLPRYTSGDKIGSECVHKMVSGFGYSPTTDEYKVVRICHKGNAWYFQVFILGNESNNWTEEKEIPYPLFHNVGYDSKGVLVNGIIHWLEKESTIVAFSLADEEFHYIASPPLVDRRPYDKRLSVLGDRLCLVHHSTPHWKGDTYIDIWLFNGNWNKEFTVQVQPRIDLIPLAFTKEGKVLFWQDCELVSCYDPKTALLETLNKVENDDDKAYLRSHQAAHHVNSFISLKALGVKNCRRRLKEYKVKLTE